MKILLFGITRDIVGTSDLQLPNPEAQSLGTVEQLKAYLLQKYPELKNISSLAFAVNSEYAAPGTTVDAADEIALIPPVSGG